MKFYTTFEVAEMLKVTEPTIREWIRSGKLEAVRLGGSKTLRISEDNLIMWLNESRVGGVVK